MEKGNHNYRVIITTAHVFHNQRFQLPLSMKCSSAPVVTRQPCFNTGAKSIGYRDIVESVDSHHMLRNIF